jgi:hypothetical protein
MRELARLDELTTGLYERALAGDVSSIDRVLAVMLRRSRLLGLDAAPPPRFGGDSHDQPLVRIEVVGDAELLRAEQAARARLGLGPHPGRYRPARGHRRDAALRHAWMAIQATTGCSRDHS